ncbi:acetyltransferase [Virgibacillus phasianinus]|uniref:Acetyltransferase n=1 Tax=Virgibacillus phasianinus TaxID=2017483 RepID=A0A220U201_9BACI|nr:acyltransferase [Virgibacillus phasianinus]ASK62284.1 acetyltransferase [Virgibacillus phasianinus]
MSGRSLFQKYNIILRIFELTSKLIPKFVFNLFWFICDNSESKPCLLLRYLYLKKYIKNCGENIFIGKGVVLKNSRKLSIGSNVSIHAYSYVDAIGGITIGDNVSIANHTSLISFEHTWENTEIPIKYNNTKKGSIKVSDDVWIGCGCRILSNVTIHERCIVAAGAVLNKDTKSNTLMGGVPARDLKQI